MCQSSPNKCEKLSYIARWALRLFSIFTVINLALVIGFTLHINKIEQKHATQYAAVFDSLSKNEKDVTYKEVQATLSNELHESQTNWLNAWIGIMTIVLAVMGIVLPLMFKDQMEKYENDFKKIKDDADETLENNTKATKTTLESIKNYDKETLDGKIEEIQKNMESIQQWRDEAETSLTQIKKDRDDAEAYALFSQGVKEKEPQRAIEYYKKAIELKPDFANAYCNMGVDYDKLGNYNEAINCYKKAIEIKPDYALAYLGIGVAYGKLKKHDEAIKYTQKAIEIKPDDASAYCNMGVNYGRLKNYDEAIKYTQKAVELKPDYAKAYYNLVEFLIFEKQTGEALKALKILNKKPEYMATGDREIWLKALDECEQNEEVEEIREIIKFMKDEEA